ncbi:13817_t:CDS:2, partial [Acaulospora morrowiae]
FSSFSILTSMVYINDWNEYQEAVEQLYLNSPKKTRYVTSWRHSTGQLVMKVTDDSLVLKYRTDQATDLKKFERLNRSMMLKMQNRKEPNESEIATSSGTIQSQQLTQVSDQTTEVIPATESAAGTSSGASNQQPSSKKKGKKGR